MEKRYRNPGVRPPRPPGSCPAGLPACAFAHDPRGRVPRYLPRWPDPAAAKTDGGKMKKLAVVVCLCTVLPAWSQTPDLKKLDFLIGKWVGVAGEKDTPLGAGQG